MSVTGSIGGAVRSTLSVRDPSHMVVNFNIGVGRNLVGNVRRARGELGGTVGAICKSLTGDTGGSGTGRVTRRRVVGRSGGASLSKLVTTVTRLTSHPMRITLGMSNRPVTAIVAPCMAGVVNGGCGSRLEGDK